MSVDLAKARQDLFDAVNGETLAKMTIREDKSAAGGFSELRDNIEDLLVNDLNKFEKGELHSDNAEMEKLIAFYRKAIDFDTRNKEGIAPLKAELDEIAALTSFEDLQAFAPKWLKKGNDFPISAYVVPDMKDTDHYALYLDRPSTLLPDKTFYEEQKEEGDRLLGVYRSSAKEALTLAGVEEVEDLVEKTISYDQSFWEYVKSSEELADYAKAYNPRTREEVKAYSEYFDLLAFSDELTGKTVDKIIVTEPRYFESLAHFFTPEHFEEIKAWMALHVYMGARNYLSEDYRQAASAYNLALSGAPETPNPERNAYNIATGAYDQVWGIYYGKKYFGPKARKDVESMVYAMAKVYQERLSENNWLSKETVEKAIKKLSAIDVMVGYPDTYPERMKKYDVHEDESLYENAKRFSQIYYEEFFGRVGDIVDRRVWDMTGDTVNAYYDPSANLICFPAGILQAPFYSLEQSRSANYGGIGAVIGHEISHAFDNNGAQFDDHGNLENWWTEEDYKQFQDKAQAMIDEFDGLQLYDLGKVNGKLTVSENIADAGGMNAAFQALKSEDGEEADAMTFFENWARVWSMKARPEYQKLLLSVDVHAPAYWRANIQPQNLDVFHETFGTKEGDKMYRKPEDRVVIW